MSIVRTQMRSTFSVVIAALLLTAFISRGAITTRPSTNSADVQLPLHFSGGFDTDGRDRGRPVVLIASALGVPSDVFREAFTHVTPAGPGQRPQDDQVRKNKKALMAKLGPYGVTDDRLNEVSNYYRYQRSAGEMWKHTAADGYAIAHNGKLQSVVLTNAGAGYSSPPTVTVESMPGVRLTATVDYEKQLATNGSVKAISFDLPAKPTTRE